jgi:hypothetical protein
MLSVRRIACVLACASLLFGGTTCWGQGAATASASAPTATHRWLDAERKPLPWQSDAEVEEFLQKASVGKSQATSKGVTRPTKMVLARDGIRAHAIFHEINEEKRFAQMRGGETIADFRDSYLFQVAAYKIARLVGLQNTPPAVKRSFGGRTGSMTMWVEGMITDEMRRAQKREPTGEDKDRWDKQMATMRVWDALIFNFDRNQGNILLDDKWNVWLIDHTRAFRRSADIAKQLRNIGQCERRLFDGMRKLTRAQVEAVAKDYLRGAEIEALFERRDMIVAQLERLARERGEDRVFFTLP